MPSKPYTPSAERQGGFLRKFLMIFIPIAIVVGFFIVTSVIVAMNK